MRFLATAAGLLAGCLLGAPAAVAQPTDGAPDLAPYQMVRSLQHVQDRVAVGDHAALPIQRRLLEMIDARLREASAAELMQPANLQAMLVYAMSGGNPATLKSILLRLHLGERDSRIAAGILGYLNGGTRNAAGALRPIDPMAEPAEIGAFIALLKGSLASLEDPNGALKLLDQARLLSPGTLVEEAALRRSISLAASVEDPERFLRAIDQYARGYIRSPYASQFADALVAGVIKLNDRLDLSSVDAVTLLMNPEQRKVIYLRIARRAVIEGHVALSKYAASKAESVIVPESHETDPRLLLYTSLTGVAEEPTEAIRQRISRIDRGKLSDGDRELLDAVLAVSEGIVRTPAALAPPSPPAADAKGPAATAPGEGASQSIERGPEPEGSAPNRAASPGETLPQVVEAPAQPPADPAPDGDDAPVEQAQALAAEPGTRRAAAQAEEPTEDHAAAAPAIAKSPDAAKPADAVDMTMAEGRKKLAEIDALLSGAED
ncbi:chemotaxis protein MotC [Mesorhizobium sp. LHD-90]|uniref:chemotaxis protein MotC n=1 Tax=Mesorhizobium sp. LHD-90 TaxID=3071414 RepID=UPI0027E00AB5|nr:chemotaxis protein MotC [Mesorhizobium sp. LHD-90]MDQ6433723.1 chemotaxis protein MotC [Mesorhizobium sp. LHD-90]